MLLPDRGEDEGDPPGLTGPASSRLPSSRDADPPMPARTHKYVPPPPVTVRKAAGDPMAAVWLRLAMIVAVFVYMMATDAKELPPGWVLGLIIVGIWNIPQKVLNAVIPGFVHRWLASRRRQSLLRSGQPVLVQTDPGDTWITHVPSIRANDANRTSVRLPFRVAAAMIALPCMFLAMVSGGEIPLFDRLIFFAMGAAFGGIALVPGGDVRRMFPRISRAAPHLPGGDPDDGG